MPHPAQNPYDPSAIQDYDLQNESNLSVTDKMMVGRGVLQLNKDFKP
jgi:hypothetical protein